MNMQSKNTPLIIGLGLVVLMVAIIIGIAVVPNKLYQPEYDFLYTYKSNYYPSEYREYTGYKVSEGRLEEATVLVPDETVLPKSLNVPFEEVLYIYEADKGASRELTFAEAEQLELDPNTISPDGFEVGYGTRSDGFLFFANSQRDYDSLYLIGHGARHKINMIKDANVDEYRYSYNFKFLGWVK